MRIGVIILNWNAAEDTISAIRAVTSWNELRPTILVVDNGSCAADAEAVSRECPDATLIQSSVNRGFAGGNNLGISEALDAGLDPILLLNNDASVGEHDIMRLIATMDSDPAIGIVGPLLYNAQEPTELIAVGGRDPVRHHLSHIMELPQAEISAVDYVPGTVCVIRNRVFEEAGLLDEDYFYSMEIADLCFRARRAGLKSVIDTRAQAFHNLARSSDVRSTLHTYYIIRNRFLFIRKFYPAAKLAYFAVWTGYALALALKLQWSGQQSSSHAVRSGLMDGLRGRFGGRNEVVLNRIETLTGCQQTPAG